MAGIESAAHPLGSTARSSRPTLDLASRLRLTLKYWLWPGINWVSRDKARVVSMLQRGTAEAPIRTLDCGCGNAYFAYEAVKRGATCLGITIHDWERRSCEEMAAFLGEAGEAMKFRVQRLDELARVPEFRGSFDQVLLFDVIARRCGRFGSC